MNVCPRCGTKDGNLSVVGIDGSLVAVQCYEERHDAAQDRARGVVAAERYIGLQNKSYARGVVSAARKATRVIFGGGR